MDYNDFWQHVEDEGFVDKLIEENDPALLLEYCSEVEDDERVWKALAACDDEYVTSYQFVYCHTIKDREEMWRSLLRCDLKDHDYGYVNIVYYLRYVKDRPELRKKLTEKDDIIYYIES